MEQEVEREIDIKDAFFYLAYRWRSIVIAAVIGLVLVAGYKYLTLDAMPSEAISEGKEIYERKVEVYKLNRDNYEAQAAMYETQLRQLQAYMEDSILIKIDPMKECYASAELYVEIPVEELQLIPESADTDITDYVLGSYENYINNSIDLSEIAKEYHVKENFMRELISAEIMYTSNQVSIKVVAPTGKLAQTVLDEAISQAKTQSGKIARDIKPHTIKVLNQTSGVRVDIDLLDTIRDLNSQISRLQGDLATTMTNAEKLEEPEQQVFVTPTSVSKRSLVKFGLIGFVAGAFLLVVVYACIYLFSGMLATPLELKDMYGYYLLGAFAPKYKKQGVIDRFLYRLAGVEKREDVVICDRIAQNIVALTESGQTVLLTGTIEDEILKQTADMLKDKVGGISLTVSRCFGEDVAAVGMIKSADAVILVEMSKKSKFVRVQELIETVQNMKKPVLGYIMY